MTSADIWSLTLTAIAITAMIVAHMELRRALREIDKLLSSRSSARSAASASLIKSHLSTPAQSRLWKWFCNLKRRTSSGPCEVKNSSSLSPYGATAIEPPNVLAQGREAGLPA